MSSLDCVQNPVPDREQNRERAHCVLGSIEVGLGDKEVALRRRNEAVSDEPGKGRFGVVDTG
jgi:hypothetical protein